ncbi:MAG: hypothetical protein SangKO_036630 [Sandaracinaceae bacterium]
MDLIDAPERLSPRTLASLRARLTAGPIVIEGAGDGVFCRGLEPSALRPGWSETLDDALADLRAVLGHLGEVPSAAVVDGDAVGGGVGLAAACALVVATPRARFALPELALGLIPAAIWPALRARCATGALVAMMTHARSVDAEHAARIGLVDVVTETPRRWLKNLDRLDPAAFTRLRALTDRVEGRAPEDARRDCEAEARAQLRDPRVLARLDRFARGEAPWT